EPRVGRGPRARADARRAAADPRERRAGPRRRLARPFPDALAAHGLHGRARRPRADRRRRRAAARRLRRPPACARPLRGWPERLRSLPNVVLSPHHGGLSDVSNLEMCSRATRAVLAVLRGEIPEGLVNPEALARVRKRA